MRKNLAKWLPHWICKESVAITLSSTCDLAIDDLVIECLESLGVRVATIVARVMKRKEVATSKFSNFDSSLQFCSHAMFHRMIFARFSRPLEYRNSVVLVLVEDL